MLGSADSGLSPLVRIWPSLTYTLAFTLGLLLINNVGQAEEIYYYHNDHLGKPEYLTDADRNIVWKAGKDPFGGGNAVVDTVNSNLRFPGQYYDNETGLHYNWHRYYNPQTGRYITSDPVGFDGGVNTYSYSLANPVRYVDLLGLWVKRCARALIALDPSETPMTPSGNPLRHDYISVSGAVLSFQAGSKLLWSQGRVDREGELPENPKCITICDDERFDQYVLEAAAEIGEPTYCIIPGMPFASNCQSWADDVLRLAEKRYLEREDCPECFGGGGPGPFEGRAF